MSETWVDRMIMSETMDSRGYWVITKGIRDRHYSILRKWVEESYDWGLERWLSSSEH